jgi:hypothetical protein
MQLAGRKLVWVCLSGAILTAGVGFGSGLLVGRQFPARRFERFGDSHYLVEPATGKVCDPFKDPKESSNPFDDAFTQENPQSANGTTDLSSIWKPVSTYPPACGK